MTAKETLRTLATRCFHECETPEDLNGLLREITATMRSKQTTNECLRNLAESIPAVMRRVKCQVDMEKTFKPSSIVRITKPFDDRFGQTGRIVECVMSKGARVLFEDGKIEGFKFASIEPCSSPSSSSQKRAREDGDDDERCEKAPRETLEQCRASFKAGVAHGVAMEKESRKAMCKTIRLGIDKILTDLDKGQTSDLEVTVKMHTLLLALDE